MVALNSGKKGKSMKHQKIYITRTTEHRGDIEITKKFKVNGLSFLIRSPAPIKYLDHFEEENINGFHKYTGTLRADPRF